MKLIDRNTGKLIASEVELADSFWRRFRGLMLRRRFPRGKALLFKFRKPGRYSVHTFFMRFPIDLVYIDSKFRVVEVRTDIRPWRIHRPKAVAKYLIELPGGTIARTRIRAGHEISPGKKL